MRKPHTDKVQAAQKRSKEYLLDLGQVDPFLPLPSPSSQILLRRKGGAHLQNALAPVTC